MTTALAFIFGYLLGSIPFGLLLTRAAGKGLAAATLFCDTFKGLTAVLMAKHFGLEAALAAALGAFLGHLFPAWLKFKGGKGVATYIGVLAGLYWPAALSFCVIWLAVAAASRYSSLAALIASALTPLSLWAFGRTNVAVLFLFLTAALWFMHRENIARLLNGTEGKIGVKAAANPD